MTPSRASLSAALGALLASRSAPWRAKSFLIAAIVAVIGLGFWVRDSVRGVPPGSPAAASAAAPEAAGRSWNFQRPVPTVTRVCGSYAGAFLLGWAFRRFLKVTLALAALALSLLALGRWTGWDTRSAESHVQAGAGFVERQAGTARNLLLGLLPSATAAGAGAFLGFRRKDPPSSAG